MRIDAFFSSLRQRSFALLWSGQTISRLGDSVYQVALAWYVLEKTGSAAIMGTVLIFSFTPMLIFLLVGGVVVDRFPRLRLMLESDLLRGLVVGLVALFAFTNLLEVWHIFVASTIFGFVDAFFHPAYVAVVPDIVPAESLSSANSLTSLSDMLTQVVGPGIGAAIVALGGTPTAFALDSLSFFASAACLVTIEAVPTQHTIEVEKANVWHDAREGITEVLRTPWLWITISIAALGNVTDLGPRNVAMPFLVKDNLHMGVETLGLVYAAQALGAVIAAVVLGRHKKLRRRGILAYSGVVVAGLMYLSVGLPIPLAAIMLAMFISGGANSVFNLIWTNTLQERVPHEMLGRVSSVDYLGSFALLPVGMGVAGWATDLFGAPTVFIIGGGITATLNLLALLHPAIRNLD